MKTTNTESGFRCEVSGWEIMELHKWNWESSTQIGWLTDILRLANKAGLEGRRITNVLELKRSSLPGWRLIDFICEQRRGAL